MWQRITHAIRNKNNEEHDQNSASGDVIAGVLEQHPNLSVFHGANQMSGPTESSGLLDHSGLPYPPSPSKRSGKRSLMKRLSKGPESELSSRPSSPSPMKLPISNPKKVKSTMSLKHNNESQDFASRLSNDTTRQSQDTVRTISGGSIVGGSLRASSKRRASLDMLRSLDPTWDQASPKASQSASRPSFDSLRRPSTPNPDMHFGSTRSILREPNTPGTGQNVRFFSRDAYKVISPNESMDSGHPALPSVFQDSVGRSNNDIGSGAVRISPTSSKVRPRLDDVFSQMSHDSPSGHPASEAPNPFDISGTLDLPPFPPGLGFEVHEPFMEPDAVFQQTLESANPPVASGPHAMTSTPFRPDKGKGKEKEILPSSSSAVDEAIFHAQEDSMDLPSSLLEHSRSLSQGNTMFYSLAHSQDHAGNRSSGASSSIISSGSESRPVRDTDSPSSVSSRQSKSRSRALSDTVFHSMLRSKDGSKIIEEPSRVASPEPPFAPAGPTADPFSANANAYYTPQSMVPGTPPKMSHSRGASKEENIILSLQNQLAIQTELCGQYEADLRARDELVSIMEKKLDTSEKEETKRKSALKVWRKKVVDLERAVRYLEDEVEHSRHESMERSVMDEASSEALRMLHRQIAGLEKERADWNRREDILRDEIGNLEGLVKDKTDEVQRLSEVVWTNTESEQQLREGIREAQAQIEMLGNVSVVVGEADQAELQQLLAKNKQNAEANEVGRVQQAAWDLEKAEFETRHEVILVEKARLEDELRTLRSQLESQDQEKAMLKAELEAQWEHTAQNSGKVDSLDKTNALLEAEKDRLSRSVEDLEQKVASLEIDWTEAENRRCEVENDAEDLWNLKEALEHEKAETDNLVVDLRQQVEDLQQCSQEQEARLNTLEHEKQYASSTISRLEETVRTVTAEATKATERIRQTESDAETLREQLHVLSREHTHLKEDHERSLATAASEGGDAHMRLQLLLKEKAEVDIELQTSRDCVVTLKEEVERLRRQIQDLQQESADREVKLVQVTKQREKDREDLQGLNIALDSKQQELELIKRRMGVKGTAGATPVKPVKTVMHRRDSSVFATPTVPRSRPSSIASDSGLENVSSVRDSKETPASLKTSGLLKSSRVSNSASTTSVRSSMGPPPPKTQTPVSKPSLSRSTSSRPSIATPTSIPPRRVSSATALERLKTPTSRPSSVQLLTDKGEKENVEGKASNTPRRRSLAKGAI